VTREEVYVTWLVWQEWLKDSKGKKVDQRILQALQQKVNMHRAVYDAMVQEKVGTITVEENLSLQEAQELMRDGVGTISAIIKSMQAAAISS